MYKIYDSFKFYHDLIESIIAALEAKDIYTADHSRRVSDMTERFCLLLNLTEDDRQEIHMAAHVHDIGKIGIPDKILSKTDKLIDEEWEIMKSHSCIGANILSNSDSLRNISDTVLHHHERWDGKGYPSGDSKLDIPIGSRIIALCDSVDAMLSHRPYRKEMSVEQCKQEIIRYRGRMYDPKLTDILIADWNKITIYNKKEVVSCQQL